ncbi:MAG: tol-pal system-associated acyl-CoA thioesterase [Xanthomonadales bacterium]|jgi:acyl-CoA thioester hydrolase|nr:tol-pal system-associated acyl-CoA thioesterase [Xanthomonadales bacterium]
MSEPIGPGRVSGYVWQVRVYWEDTDAGGVVYHGQYLNFFERARTEWLRSRGIHQARLAEETGVVFAIRRMQVDWRYPARLDDLLDVSVHSVTAGATRLDFHQDMERAGDGKLLATATVTAACLDAATFKPTRMPESIRLEISNAE